MRRHNCVIIIDLLPLERNARASCGGQGVRRRCMLRRMSRCGLCGQV